MWYLAWMADARRGSDEVGAVVARIWGKRNEFVTKPLCHEVSSN
jgi:hypothetical protein